MQSRKDVLSILGACLVVISLSAAVATRAFAGPGAEPQAAPPTAARQVVGAIKAIQGDVITVAPDSGAQFNIEVRTNVRVLRVAPGETNLAKATPIQFSDLQVGDRVLVQATPGADAQSLVATRVVAMKKTDVDAKQEADRQDWQKRGIAGLVSAVDPAAGVLTVSAGGAGGNRSVAVHTSKDTSVRRYAPDSVRFDDAVPSAVAQIKAGDQVRARGTRNADGNELAAEEIIAGTFRNIAGVISAVDAAANSITVNDLATRKPVMVKVSAQSQVTKLTPEAAQGVAARAKAAGAATGGAGPAAGGAGRGPGGGGRGGGGQADLQQVISRMPPATLANFAKGEAVMVVSTEGTAAGGVTAIMLVGGVEPILTAPGGAQQTLAPWDLGGGGGDAGQ
jgi:hypothetical protein